MTLNFRVESSIGLDISVTLDQVKFTLSHCGTEETLCGGMRRRRKGASGVLVGMWTLRSGADTVGGHPVAGSLRAKVSTKKPDGHHWQDQ